MQNKKEFKKEGTVAFSDISKLESAIDGVVISMNARKLSDLSLNLGACFKSKSASDSLFFIDGFISDVMDEINEFFDTFKEDERSLNIDSFEAIMNSCRARIVSALASEEIDISVNSKINIDVLSSFDDKLGSYTDVIHENYLSSYGYD